MLPPNTDHLMLPPLRWHFNVHALDLDCWRLDVFRQLFVLLFKQLTFSTVYAMHTGHGHMQAGAAGEQDAHYL
jgi:hypothetical protein